MTRTRAQAFSFPVHVRCCCVEDNTSHCYHDTEDTVATDNTTRPDPTQSHDSNSLGVTYHCAGYRTCSGDDSELREVEETCAETALFLISACVNKIVMLETYHHDHKPSVERHFAEDWQGVYEGYEIYEQHASNQRLVVEQLQTCHLQLLMVMADPTCVDTAHEDTTQGEHHAIEARSFARSSGPDIEVCHHSHASAYWEQGAYSLSWNGLLVESIVQKCSDGCEQDSGRLIEGDGRVGERQVRENDVQAHCSSQRKNISKCRSFALEEAKS